MARVLWCVCVLLVLLVSEVVRGVQHREQQTTHSEHARTHAQQLGLEISEEEQPMRGELLSKREAAAASLSTSTKSFSATGNPMSHLTFSEYAQRLGYRRNGKSRNHQSVTFTGEHFLASASAAPERVDWRREGVVTAVKDQGSCGSCWAFSAVESVESAAAIADGELRSLSEQEVLDCDTFDGNMGCHGGEMNTALQFIRDHGIDTETDYRYKARDEQCDTKKEERAVVHIDDVANLPENDEEALKVAVAQQPVSVAISAGHLPFMLYSGGVLDSSDCGGENAELDHGVVVVGYDEVNGTQYWIVRNSFGSHWGENGYFRLKRNVSISGGTCGLAKDMSVPVKLTRDPPSPPPADDGSDDDDGNNQPVACDVVRSCPKSFPHCCCLNDVYGMCIDLKCCADDGVGRRMHACLEGDGCCEDDKPFCDAEKSICKQAPSDRDGTPMKSRVQSFFSFNPFAGFGRYN